MQIPADLVVNAIIVAMAAHGNQQCETNIYQVGSSVKNPLRYSDLHEYGFRYFDKKPWIGKDGKPIKVRKVTILDSMDSFHRYMNIRYLLFLKVRTLIISLQYHLFKFYYQSDIPLIMTTFIIQ